MALKTGCRNEPLWLNLLSKWQKCRAPWLKMHSEHCKTSRGNSSLVLNFRLLTEITMQIQMRAAMQNSYNVLV